MLRHTHYSMFFMPISNRLMALRAHARFWHENDAASSRDKFVQGLLLLTKLPLGLLFWTVDGIQIDALQILKILQIKISEQFLWCVFLTIIILHKLMF